jgi:hypothetical protein
VICKEKIEKSLKKAITRETKVQHSAKFMKIFENPIDENVLVNYNEATKTYSHAFAEMLQKGII